MSPLLLSLVAIAREAGGRILDLYGEPLVVDRKPDDSPLTRADRASHDAIGTALKERLPGIPVISEEDAEPAGTGHPRFILVDPLDGTKEFIKRSGDFTVNIGLVEEGRPVAGVVHVPVGNLTYAAGRDEGAWRIDGDSQPARIRVSAAGPRLRFVASRDHAGPRVAALLARFPGAGCVSIGSSLKFCLVAEGRADAYLRDAPTMEWDTAAAQALVEEAGGVVIDLETRRPLAYGKPDRRNPGFLAASTGALADRLLGT